MKSVISLSILMFVSLTAIGQQQRTTINAGEGSKIILDLTAGMTVVEKNGDPVPALSAVETTKLCDSVERGRICEAASDDSRLYKFICDEWWKLQPKAAIERVPFKTLVSRLLFETAPSSDFMRFRGMELKSGAESKTYDAIIVPNDFGYDVSCTIEEENRHNEGMLFTYRCSTKTPSFAAAIELKGRLVQALSNLHLKEDEVREHGLSAHARDGGFCAPSGECLEQHVYATTTKDWKSLQIEADPSFTVNAIAALMAKGKGRPPITGIDANLGLFSFEIFSVGPQEEH